MTKEQLKTEWRKRNTYHPPKTEGQRNAHVDVGNIILEAGLSLIDVCPESRELSTALTWLTLVRMLANASLAVHVNAAELMEETAETVKGKPVGLRIPESFRLKGDGNIVVDATDTGITIGLAPRLDALMTTLKTCQWTQQDYEALAHLVLEMLEHGGLPFAVIYNNLTHTFYKFRDDRDSAKNSFGGTDNLLRNMVEERCLQQTLEALAKDGKLRCHSLPTSETTWELT